MIKYVLIDMTETDFSVYSLIGGGRWNNIYFLYKEQWKCFLQEKARSKDSLYYWSLLKNGCIFQINIYVTPQNVSFFFS